MSYLQMDLFTTRSLAKDECAEEVYRILDAWDFPPDTFDEYEPIRQPWSKKDDFIKAWRQQGRLHFGQVLVRRKKRLSYYADVVFQFGSNRKLDNKPPYHALSVYRLKESHCARESRERLVNLGDLLFSALEMDYGFMCTSDEYDAKNIVKNVLHPDGAIEPRKAIGMNWPYCIPGLYWINHFGKRYLDQGFAAAVYESYPANVKPVGSGIRFQTNAEPRFFESAEAMAAEREMRESLGALWFFDREDNRDRDSIEVSFEQLRSPAHGS